MKRAAIIATVVAACSLLETALLLSSILPHSWYPLGTYQAVVLWGQLLTIPGMAAVFSRIFYGAHNWRRRTLTILLAGSLGVPVAITAVATLAVLLAWTADVSLILFGVLTPVVGGAVALGILFCIRKFDNWNVQAEAVRWLAEREAGLDLRARRRRDREIRLALWIPSTTVLLVFLFLPETLGLSSHLGWPRPGNLVGYQVTIPATWIVRYNFEDDSDGRSGVDGLIGKGIGRGGNPLRRDSISSWDVGTKPFNKDSWGPYSLRGREEQNVTSHRVLRTGNESITCLDFRFPYERESKTTAYVECSSSGRLYAGFYGSRGQLGTFYHMLEGVKSTP